MYFTKTQCKNITVFRGFLTVEIFTKSRTKCWKNSKELHCVLAPQAKNNFRLYPPKIGSGGGTALSRSLAPGLFPDLGGRIPYHYPLTYIPYISPLHIYHFYLPLIRWHFFGKNYESLKLRRWKSKDITVCEEVVNEHEAVTVRARSQPIFPKKKQKEILTIFNFFNIKSWGDFFLSPGKGDKH